MTNEEIEKHFKDIDNDDLTDKKYTYLEMMDAFFAGGDYRESLMTHMIEKYGENSQPNFRDFMHRKFLNDDLLDPQKIQDNPLNTI
jgi:hypothetical protein